MKNLPIIGKYLIISPSIVFGIFHLMNAKKMAKMVPNFLPEPQLWVYLTGLCLIAGGVAILIGKKAKLAAHLMGLLILTFVIFVHFPGAIDGQPMPIGMLLRDLSMIGGFWYLSASLSD
ncbi:MAG: DoxX family membrane protein [Reichenbachiella sp.]